MIVSNFGIIGSILYLAAMIWLLWHMGEPRREHKRYMRRLRRQHPEWFPDNPEEAGLRHEREQRRLQAAIDSIHSYAEQDRPRIIVRLEGPGHSEASDRPVGRSAFRLGGHLPHPLSLYPREQIWPRH